MAAQKTSRGLNCIPLKRFSRQTILRSCRGRDSNDACNFAHYVSSFRAQLRLGRPRTQLSLHLFSHSRAATHVGRVVPCPSFMSSEICRGVFMTAIIASGAASKETHKAKPDSIAGT